MKGKRRLIFAALAALGLTRGARTEDAASEAPIPLEYKVKAAYIFNFARFVIWPDQTMPTADSPIVVGFLGRDNFTNTLPQTLAGRHIEGHPIQLKEFSSIDAVHGVHVLLIARSKDAEISDVVQVLAGQPVLTVSERRGFISDGGMIWLHLDGSQVKFTVNLPAIKQAGLKVSSQMLQYAQVVE